MWHRSEALRLTKIKKIRPELHTRNQKESEGISWRQPSSALVSPWWHSILEIFLKSGGAPCSFFCLRKTVVISTYFCSRSQGWTLCRTVMLVATIGRIPKWESSWAQSTCFKYSQSFLRPSAKCFYQDVLTLQRSKALLDAQGSTSSTTRISVYCPTFPATERKPTYSVAVVVLLASLNCASVTASSSVFSVASWGRNGTNYSEFFRTSSILILSFSEIDRGLLQLWVLESLNDRGTSTSPTSTLAEMAVETPMTTCGTGLKYLGCRGSVLLQYFAVVFCVKGCFLMFLVYSWETQHAERSCTTVLL